MMVVGRLFSFSRQAVADATKVGRSRRGVNKSGVGEARSGASTAEFGGSGVESAVCTGSRRRQR